MQHIYVPFLFLLSFSAGAQTVVFDDNFDTYTLGQGTAVQSPVWESYTGPNGGADDALVSDEHALSAPHAMKISNGKDMFYPFEDISTGAYTIEFNMFLHNQGYLNIQHNREINWALDLYFTNTNEILYLDEDGVANCISIGTYANDTWMNIRFHVDLDADSVWTYKDGVLLHTSVFSNSQDGQPSNHLDVVNFYGLAGFNGVSSSLYYIDDFKVTDVTSAAAIADQSASGITVFPNPAKEQLTVSAETALKSVTVTTLSGECVLERQLSGLQEKLSLAQFAPGIYLVEVRSETGTAVQRLVVE